MMTAARQTPAMSVVPKSTDSKTHLQLPIPGLNLNEIRVQALMRRFPVPMERESAEIFFRSNCVFSLKYKEDIDIIKVALKGKDGEDDTDKRELTINLYVCDQTSYNSKYLRTAQILYRQWLDIEKDKLSNDQQTIDSQIDELVRQQKSL
jgi:hypothetical protein